MQTYSDSKQLCHLGCGRGLPHYKKKKVPWHPAWGQRHVLHQSLHSTGLKWPLKVCWHLDNLLLMIVKDFSYGKAHKGRSDDSDVIVNFFKSSFISMWHTESGGLIFEVSLVPGPCRMSHQNGAPARAFTQWLTGNSGTLVKCFQRWRCP